MRAWGRRGLLSPPASTVPASANGSTSPVWPRACGAGCDPTG